MAKKRKSERVKEWLQRSFSGASVPSFFLLLLAIACSNLGSATQHRPHHDVDEFARQEGQRLYQHYCAACHGGEGRGDGIYFATGLEPRPPDFTKSGFGENSTDQKLLAAITGETESGDASHSCAVPWGNTFNHHEIEYLVTYIKVLAEASRKDPEDGP